MKKISFKWIFNLSVLAISLGVLCYFAFSEDGILDLVKNVKGVKMGWLFGALLSVMVSWMLECQILFMFVRTFHPKYSYFDCLQVSMAGQFFCAVTPFASGGQPMQLYIMKQQGVNASSSLSAMIQKFIIFQSSMTGYALFLIALNFRFFREKLSSYMYMAIIALLINFGIICFFYVFSSNRGLTRTVFRWIYFALSKLGIVKNPEEKLASFQEQLDLFHDNNILLKRNKKLAVKSVVFTLLQLTTLFLVPICIYKSFQYPGYPLAQMMTANSVVTMIAAFIPLPGGSGAAEGSFFIFFSIFFTLPGTLKPAVFLWRFITYYLSIAMSSPFALARKRKQLEPSDAAA